MDRDEMPARGSAYHRRCSHRVQRSTRRYWQAVPDLAEPARAGKIYSLVSLASSYSNRHITSLCSNHYQVEGSRILGPLGLNIADKNDSAGSSNQAPIIGNPFYQISRALSSSRALSREECARNRPRFLGGTLTKVVSLQLFAGVTHPAADRVHTLSIHPKCRRWKAECPGAPFISSTIAGFVHLRCVLPRSATPRPSSSR
ncbi:hypothetical protein B0H15DRAFT_427208 [Mycena belliarum]|uniref:Uncharacterized protein n=1 Tax=Mycena belliarum TaxID=1033014 RepID=A0AAD6XP06_9AGAR|nr:hypothetical protein B0H15DRAFT_427208 [Mycena belliae]